MEGSRKRPERSGLGNEFCFDLFCERYGMLKNTRFWTPKGEQRAPKVDQKRTTVGPKGAKGDQKMTKVGPKGANGD